MPGHLCSRCGSSEHIQISDTEMRCAECGLDSSFARLVAISGSDPAPPDPGIARLLAMKEQMQQRFLEATFSPFALDSRWTGLRSFGGCGGSNGETDHLSLAHGDVGDPEAVQVRVETRRPQQIGLNGPRDPVFERAMAARELVNHFWHATGNLPDDVRAAAFPNDEGGPFSRVPTAPWDDATIPVDGEPVAFKVLSDKDFWAGLGQVDDLFIAMTSNRWPIADTGLVPVTDFDVYAAGSQEIEARMRRRHENPE